jgi:hypothetical protein
MLRLTTRETGGATKAQLRRPSEDSGASELYSLGEADEAARVAATPLRGQRLARTAGCRAHSSMNVLMKIIACNMSRISAAPPRLRLCTT